MVQQTSPDNRENVDITATVWKCFKPGLMLRSYLLQSAWGYVPVLQCYYLYVGFFTACEMKPTLSGSCGPTAQNYTVLLQVGKALPSLCCSKKGLSFLIFY